MALSQEFVGRHFRYPDYYLVEREKKIREHARSIQNSDPAFFSDEAAAELGYDDILAPLTFTSMLGYAAQTAFFEHANIGITDKQIVQIDQVLKFFSSRSRPATSSTVTSTSTRFGRRTAPTSLSPRTLSVIRMTR